MSKFPFVKKFRPARKAWKSFTARLRSKLNNPKFMQVIKTSRKCWPSIPSFFSRKFLGLTTRRPSHPICHLHRFHPSASAIFVDELFARTMSLEKAPRKGESLAESSKDMPTDKSKPGLAIRKRDNAKIQTPKAGEVGNKFLGDVPKGSAEGKGKAKAGDSGKNCERWKVPPMPQFRGIDERAEEFIAKVRHDMKLEREQSIIEFEEMLKRST